MTKTHHSHTTHNSAQYVENEHELEVATQRNDRNYAKYVMEFLGTFFLVLTITLSVKLAGNFAPFAIAGVLALMIYAGGHISGANYNPAVSFGLFLSGKLSASDMIGYMISQVLGAFLGSMIGYQLLGSVVGTQLVVSPAEGISMARWVLAEFLFTFLLVFVVLQVATSKKITNNQFFGLAIGLVVLVGALSVGGISGGAFNPAVALGPQLFDMFLGGHSINNILGYLLAGFAGAGLASMVYNYTEKNI